MRPPGAPYSGGGPEVCGLTQGEGHCFTGARSSRRAAGLDLLVALVFRVLHPRLEFGVLLEGLAPNGFDVDAFNDEARYRAAECVPSPRADCASTWATPSLTEPD